MLLRKSLFYFFGGLKQLVVFGVSDENKRPPTFPYCRDPNKVPLMSETPAFNMQKR